MKIHIKYVIGQALLILGVIFILAGVAIFGLASVLPLVFPPQFRIIIGVIAAVGIPIAIIGNLMADIFGFTLRDTFQSRKHSPPTKEDYFPFQMIVEPGEVLPSLMPGPGLIPDHKLPYQRRRSGQNITEELRESFLKSRKLLITGVAGLGKTREAGKLISDLIDEGFTLLRAKNDIRSDRRIDFPDNLRRSVVFLFDDFHQRCADPFTTFDENLKPEEFLTYLHSFIKNTEKHFMSSDVYVIFISRSDTEAWDNIQFPHHPIWKNVQRFDLPFPDIESQKELILKVADQLEIKISADDARKLANVNDGTFRNLLQNLYRSKRTNARLNLETFKPRQLQTWNDRYEDLRKKYPREIPAIFDALNILFDIGLPLHSQIINALSTEITLKKYNTLIRYSARWLIRRKISRILSKLEADGDLKKMNLPTPEYAVHEVMLSVKQTSQLVHRQSLSKIWNYTLKMRRPYPVDGWLSLAGHSLGKAGQLRLGVRILTHILRGNPNHVNARCMRAGAIVDTGFQEQALEDINIAYTLDPMNLVVLNTRSYINFTLDNTESAIDDLDQAISLAPSDYVFFANKANIYLYQGNYKDAEANLSQAIILRDDYAPFFVKRARTRWMLGKRQLAEEDLSQALEKQPKWSSVYVERAIYYLEDNQLDLAEEEIKKAIEIAPDLAEAYYVYTNIAIQRDDYGLGEQLIATAIRIMPYVSKYYYSRGHIHWKQKKHEMSVIDLNQAISINNGEPNYFLLRANVLNQLGQIKSARRDYERCLALAPDNIEAMVSLGKVYAANGQNEKALEMLNRCLEINQKLDRVFHIRAHIYARQGKSPLAIRDFSKAEELSPQNASHSFCQGRLHRRLNRRKAAIKDFAKAKSLSPENIHNHAEYINTLVSANRSRRVKEIYLREVSKQPENPMYLVLVSYICALNKDFDEAEEYLKRSYELQIDDAAILYYQFLIVTLFRRSLTKFLSIQFKSISHLSSTDSDIVQEMMLHYIDNKIFKVLVYWSLEIKIIQAKFVNIVDRVIQIIRAVSLNKIEILTERDLHLK